MIACRACWTLAYWFCLVFVPVACVDFDGSAMRFGSEGETDSCFWKATGWKTVCRVVMGRDYLLNQSRGIEVYSWVLQVLLLGDSVQ